jgi:exonuclease SbcC
MIIKKIVLVGFKGYEDPFNIEFSVGTNEIEGRNAIGKTSLRDAVVWCLYGCDIYGKSYTRHLINNNSHDCVVECELISGGKDYKVSRFQNDKGESHVRLNGKRYSQKFIEDCLLPEKEIFLTFFVEGYFNSIDVDKKRLVLGKHIEPPDKAALLDGIIDRSIMEKHGYDEDSDADDAKKERRAARGKIDKLTGKLSTLEESLEEFEEFDEETIDVSSIEDEIEELSERRDEIRENLSKVERKKLLQEELGKLKPIVELKSQDLYEAEEALKEARDFLSNRRAESYALTSIPDEDVCPTCTQKINKSLRDGIKNKAIALNSIIKDGQKKEKKALARWKKLSDINDANEETIERREEIEAELEALKNIDELMDDAKITEHIEELIAKQVEANKFNESVLETKTDKKAVKKRIKDANKEIGALTGEEKELDMIAKALDTHGLPAKITEYYDGVLSGNLERVEFVLQEVVHSTGKMKDTFKIFYDGKPIEICSTSERARAHIEIVEAIGRIGEVNFPVFIDGGESISGKIESEQIGQVLVSYVNEDAENMLVNGDEVSTEPVAEQPVKEKKKEKKSLVF